MTTATPEAMEKRICEEISAMRDYYFTAADSRQSSAALSAIETIDGIATKASHVLNTARKAIDDIAVSIASREGNNVFPEIIKRIQEKHKKEGKYWNPKEY